MTRWREVFSRERRGGQDGHYAEADTDLGEARLRGMSLVHSRFERCSFDGSAIEYADWDDAELIDCHAVPASFVFGRMYRTKWTRCALERVDLRRVRLVHATITDCNLDRALMIETPVVECRIERTSFRAAKLWDSQIDRTGFVDCDLRDADLHDNSLYGTSFVGCDLRGVDLTGRNLGDTSFERCKMHGIRGLPRVQGPVTVTDPDLSEAGDGSGVVPGDALLATWPAPEASPDRTFRAYTAFRDAKPAKPKRKPARRKPRA
jgi:uncharacterized protein YjbI with pentapeptide repeats